MSDTPVANKAPGTTASSVDVTGYELREAIRRTALERDTLWATFNDEQTYFEGELKEPKTTMDKYLAMEQRLSRLQAAQDAYNLAILSPEGESLAFLVNIVGGLGRAAKGWRSFATPNRRSSYFDRELTRSATDLVAKPTLPRAESLVLAIGVERDASHVRALIATLNATRVKIVGLSQEDVA